MNSFGMENAAFFGPKHWWKYDIYWLLKSPFLTFLGMGNTVFFWEEKLMERWYLLVTEKFLFWTFWWWEIRSFLDKRLIERWYLLVTETFLFWATKKFLFLNFPVMGNTVFFFSLKIGVKIIFSWYFYGSSCSGSINW